MTNGILSPHEATVIVSLTDPSSDKPLSRIAELFSNNFREDTSRVRAIFALRTLLGFESTTNGNALLPTSPEVIAMLFLLHVAASSSTEGSVMNKKDVVSAESRDFAAAALYEHLLRVEDLLRDDALLFEQRKYRSSTIVAGGNNAPSTGGQNSHKEAGGQNSSSNQNGNASSSPANNNSNNANKDPKQKTKDAIEQDAYRGHLLQKVFIVHCLVSKQQQTSAAENALVIDFSKRVSVICTDTSLDALEAVVTSWGATPESKTQISDAINRLKASYDRECLTNASAATNTGATQGNNLSGMNFANRAVSSIVPESGLICQQAMKGTKHFLTTNAPEMGLTTSSQTSESSSSDNNNNNTSTTVLAPYTAITSPPLNRARIIRDTRYLLPPSNPFVLDTVPHPQDWKEAKGLIETAASGTELNAQQLSKLTSLLADSGSSSSGNNGAKGGKGKSGKANDKDQSNADLFPFLGLTPQTFGRIARANPKAAAAILNATASRFGTPTGNSDPYVKELIEFNYSSNPDYCPTVVLAASKNGLISASHLSTYVNRAKAYAMSCINAKEKNEFLKNFCVSLHQIAEKTPLESIDKSIVQAMLNGNSELTDVAKMWS